MEMRFIPLLDMGKTCSQTRGTSKHSKKNMNLETSQKPTWGLSKKRPIGVKTSRMGGGNEENKMAFGQDFERGFQRPHGHPLTLGTMW